MLKTINPILSPELLYTLARMGHGNEICLVDANFPAAETAGANPLIRMPGVAGPLILEAVLSLFPLDTFVEMPAAVMAVVGAPDEVPPVVAEYQAICDRVEGRAIAIERVERHAFYARARTAFALVQTGERRYWGNILLRKGAFPPPG